MRARNSGSVELGVHGSKDYSVEILREIYHSDPDHRCLAALNRWGLDVLKNDEVWLVRHVARRMIRAQELEAEGIILSPGDVEYADVHIDDMVYELYKADWMNKNTTPEMRMQRIRSWCNDVLMSREHNWLPHACNYWLEENGYLGKDGRGRALYENFYMFLGCMRPGHKGVYHDREYVAELLGHDETLLALYDADINDDKELSYRAPSIGDRLEDAAERSKQAKHKDTSRDDLILA